MQTDDKKKKPVKDNTGNKCFAVVTAIIVLIILITGLAHYKKYGIMDDSPCQGKSTSMVIGGEMNEQALGQEKSRAGIINCDCSSFDVCHT